MTTKEVVKSNENDTTKYLNLFSDVKVIDYNNIDQKFIEKLAKSLLSKYVLVVGKKEYRLGEIEFYINNAKHNDKYTHGDKNQKTYGKWYFHRYQNGSYKSGTYKGVDLTLGNDDTYFGVLIRSIYDPDTDEMVEGPCRTVNTILELYGYFDVSDYMKTKKDPLSARLTKNFYLKRKSKLEEEIVYKGPRIGLSDKYPEWKDVPYRFLIKKAYIKKGKSNLVQVQ